MGRPPESSPSPLSPSHQTVVQPFKAIETLSQAVPAVLRIPFLLRIVRQVLKRARQLRAMRGRGWRWQRSLALTGRAAATVLLAYGLIASGSAHSALASGAHLEGWTGASNPFNGADVGDFSTPTFVDIDSDGDLDAFVSNMNGDIQYFQNTGTALTPVLVLDNADNPLSGITSASSPAFADLDGDGDLDVFLVSNKNGSIRYFKNTGSAPLPVFSEVSGTGNPFNGVAVSAYKELTLVDIDRDGDLDTFIRLSDGSIATYQNTGTPLAATFSLLSGSANPFNGLTVTGIGKPAFGDLDRDGDLDALMGVSDGSFAYAKNTGTRQSPVFAFQSGAANPYNGLDVGDGSAPALVDIDADGDLDLFSGEIAGTILYYANMDDRNRVKPVYTQQSGPDNPLDTTYTNFNTPALVDIDGDGDLDAFIGEMSNIYYYLNTGTRLAPVFVLQPDTANPFYGLLGTTSTKNAALVFTDLDGDGDQDAFLSIRDPNYVLKYFQNTGTPTAPVFTLQTGASDPFSSVAIQTNRRTMPSFVDIDSNGVLEAFLTNKNEGVRYFKNIGTASSPLLVQATGSANPLELVNLTGATEPGNFNTVFADVDGDRDLDAYGGYYFNPARILFYENTGTPWVPQYVNQTGADNPFTGKITTGANSAYTVAPPVDLDGDGDLDVILGLGTTSYYLENTATNARNTPSFTPRSGPVDPFNGLSAGTLSAPTLVDIDSDGDLDAFVGSADGPIHYYQNTGTPLKPIFVEQTGAANPLNLEASPSSTPVFVDIDLDGDLDVFSGGSNGRIFYSQNTGSARQPVFTDMNLPDYPLSDQVFSGDTSLAFTDIDRDGDPDAFVGSSDGLIHFYRNSGAPNAPVLTEVNGIENPFFDVNVGSNSSLAFADVDQDGDQDAVVGSLDGSLKYYKNSGTPLHPVFSTLKDGAIPLNAVDVGSNSMPAFADIDGDGDSDVLVGNAAGGITYYENSNCSFASDSNQTLAEGDVLQLGVGNSALRIKINTLGTLTSLSATCAPANHPQAVEPALQTGAYWTIEANAGATGFNLDVTLPMKSPDANDRLCRYDTNTSAWDCAQSSHTATDITRAGVTNLSDWTTADITIPDAVLMMETAARSVRGGVDVSWRTAQELDLLGFHVYRSESLGGERLRLTPDVYPAQAPGSLEGGVYHYTDQTAEPGRAYDYWLEAIYVHSSQVIGPLERTWNVFLPITQR